MTDKVGLTDNQRAFVKLKLNHPGFSIRKIAEELNVAEDTAYRYNIDPEVRAALDEAHAEAMRVIRDMRLKATLKLAGLLESDKESVRLKAIELVLKDVIKGSSDKDLGKAADLVDQQLEPLSKEDWIATIRDARGLE